MKNKAIKSLSNIFCTIALLVLLSGCVGYGPGYYSPGYYYPGYYTNTGYNSSVGYYSGGVVVGHEHFTEPGHGVGHGFGHGVGGKPPGMHH